MRTTCIFGVIYVIVGNLSGNAVALGIYILQAAGIEGNDPLVRGLAVVSLTVACLLHASWRKGGIVVNNVLAVMKALVLVAIIVIGFAASAGASFGHGPVHGETVNPETQAKTSNFDTQTSFAFARNDPAGYAEAFLYVTYTFKGYEQPFYVRMPLHTAVFLLLRPSSTPVKQPSRCNHFTSCSCTRASPETNIR